MLWTTKLSDDAPHFALSSDAEALTHYGSASAFAQPRSFYTNSPFQRPSRPQDISDVIISSRLTSDQLSDSHHLLAQRLLLNIYEQDLVFLPKPPMELDLKAFKQFYDPEHAASGKKIRPLLEQYLYDWLKQEVHIKRFVVPGIVCRPHRQGPGGCRAVGVQAAQGADHQPQP